jgi:hypothetical protein
MTASEREIRKIQQEAGWTDDTLIHLVGRWIDFGTSETGQTFVDFLREILEDEQTEM